MGTRDPRLGTRREHEFGSLLYTPNSAYLRQIRSFSPGWEQREHEISANFYPYVRIFSFLFHEKVENLLFPVFPPLPNGHFPAYLRGFQWEQETRNLLFPSCSHVFPPRRSA